MFNRTSVLTALAVMAASALTASATPVDEAESQAIAAICTATAYAPTKGEISVAIQPGMGEGGFKVDANPEAQKWFDYGVKLYHAFYHEDTKLAFEKAAKADPTCAMCVWGQALAEGPTQNFDVSGKETVEALALAKKAESLAGGASQRDKDLIQALIIRYTFNPKLSAAKTIKAADYSDLDAETAYARAMEKISTANPDSDDLAALAAHAWLAVRDDNMKPDAGRAMAILEQVLKRNPESSSATHFYIHATEFNDTPAMALPYAKKLAGEAPGSSHLVHMAAHTFFRVGLYEDAAIVNADALAVAANHNKADNAPGDLAKTDYYGHNYGFGLGGAMMAGDAPLALKFAQHAPYAWPDAAAPQRLRADVAYGIFDPKDALAISDPKAKDHEVVYHYVRGEAFARLGDAKGLATEIAAMPDSGFFHLADDHDVLYRRVLEGRAAMLAGQPEKAVAAFSKAAALQHKLYEGDMDPPPFWYPLDRSVAAAWLKAGRYDEAAKAAQTSLKGWPQDALALSVLAQAEDKLGRSDDAKTHRDEARKAWRGPDLAQFNADLI